MKRKFIQTEMNEIEYSFAPKHNARESTMILDDLKL